MLVRWIAPSGRCHLWTHLGGVGVFDSLQIPSEHVSFGGELGHGGWRAVVTDGIVTGKRWDSLALIAPLIGRSPAPMPVYSQSFPPNAIREWALTVVPPGNLPVPDLLAFRLPPLINESSTNPTTTATSLAIRKLNRKRDALLDIAMPPCNWVTEVDNILKYTTHRSDAHSVSHPIQPNMYVPLYAIYLWQVLCSPVEQRAAWSTALEFLKH